MWDEMGLVRVYTKPQGQQPDFSDPVVLSAVCCLPFCQFRYILMGEFSYAWEFMVFPPFLFQYFWHMISG
jgi:ribosome-interacting GTPase 1